MPEIGATLREARMRARIDVSEIEATTKIRAKYLRALENEEWSLLPGPTFVKSFLRTYAQALGLDGKALVEEYRLSHEQPGEAGINEPIVPSGERRRGRGLEIALEQLDADLLAPQRRRFAPHPRRDRDEHQRRIERGVVVAAPDLARVRVPARRRWQGADPGPRAAAGGREPHLPCKAL